MEPTHLIPLLQEIQNHYKFLPRTVLEQFSHLTSLPMSRIYGVISFYEQFRLKKGGVHRVRCCRGTACHVKGGEILSEKIALLLNVDDQGLSDDGLFGLETVACLGTCFLAPVMMIDDRYYGNLDENSLREIFDEYRGVDNENR